MTRTRVKICGITRRDDALVAVEAGADALGFVFYPPSPRALSLDELATVCEDLPPFVTRVALFVDPAPDLVAAVLDSGLIDLLQFHGQESPAFCQSFGRPYLKALAMRPELSVTDSMAEYAQASGILLDAWHPAVPGGSGERFDWERIPRERPRPLILAGGLTPANVAQAIRQTRPYAVDVSSGVEASRGVKDAGLIRSFIRGVNSVYTETNG